MIESEFHSACVMVHVTEITDAVLDGENNEICNQHIPKQRPIFCVMLGPLERVSLLCISDEHFLIIIYDLPWERCLN